MSKPIDKQPNDHHHYAAGLKTALLVCVIGFIAFAANHSLVAPGGAAATSASASDVAVTALAPADAAASAPLPAPAADSVSTYDGGDNHPPSF